MNLSILAFLIYKGNIWLNKFKVCQNEITYRNFIIFETKKNLNKIIDFNLKDIFFDDKDVILFKDIDNDNLLDLIICGIDYLVLGYENGKLVIKEKIENFGGDRLEGTIKEVDGNIFVTGKNTIIYTKSGKRIDIKDSIGYGYIINDKIYGIKGRFYRIYAGSGKFGILNGPLGIFTFDGKELLNTKEIYFKDFKKVGNFYILIDVFNRGFIFDKNLEPLFKIPIDKISWNLLVNYKDREILILEDYNKNYYVLYDGKLLKLNECDVVSDFLYIHPYLYITYKNEIKIYNLDLINN